MVNDEYDEYYLTSSVLICITLIPILMYLYYVFKFCKNSGQIFRNKHNINEQQEKRIERMFNKESISTRHRYNQTDLKQTQNDIQKQ